MPLFFPHKWRLFQTSWQLPSTSAAVLPPRCSTSEAAWTRNGALKRPCRGHCSFVPRSTRSKRLLIWLHPWDNPQVQLVMRKRYGSLITLCIYIYIHLQPLSNQPKNMSFTIHRNGRGYRKRAICRSHALENPWVFHIYFDIFTGWYIIWLYIIQVYLLVYPLPIWTYLDPLR